MIRSDFLAKSKLLVKPSSGPNFLASIARLTFTKLGQVFIKILILHHFDLKYFIWVEIDILGYTIDIILNQLTSNNLGE